MVYSKLLYNWQHNGFVYSSITTNTLCYDIIMATTSLGSKDFSASLQCYRPTVIHMVLR